MPRESDTRAPLLSRRALLWAAGVALAASGIVLTACSSGQSTTGTVNGQSYSAASSQLPSGFPSDVPTPKNSRVLGGGGSGNNWDAAFAVTGSVGSGTSAYQSQLRSAGYTVSDIQSGSTPTAAGATFSANNSKWTLQVASGSSAAAASTGSLKSGEFALNVTVTPAGGSAGVP